MTRIKRFKFLGNILNNHKYGEKQRKYSLLIFNKNLSTIFDFVKVHLKLKKEKLLRCLRKKEKL